MKLLITTHRAYLRHWGQWWFLMKIRLFLICTNMSSSTQYMSKLSKRWLMVIYHFILLCGLANFMWASTWWKILRKRIQEMTMVKHHSIWLQNMAIWKRYCPRNNQEWTPLHFAAASGHTAVCKLFMETLEYKFPKNDVGQMPQHLAALQGFHTTARFLWGFVME